MKREIKFRAWDGEQMLFSHNNTMNKSEFQLGWFFQKIDNIDKGVELMQYTGLKDSKGVEIYEGDIFDKGIVVFSNGCFNGCYTCGTTSKKGWDYSDEWEDGLAEYARKNKVIGNIYQNPELINI